MPPYGHSELAFTPWRRAIGTPDLVFHLDGTLEDDALGSTLSAPGWAMRSPVLEFQHDTGYAPSFCEP